MIAEGSVARALFNQAGNEGSALTVDDVRIGLGYAAVALEGNRLGLAAVLRGTLDGGCTVSRKAGTLAGSNARDLLPGLVEGRNALEKTLGLATANAICNAALPAEKTDTLELLNLAPDDHVVMVGYFGPLVERIGSTGARLSILETDPARCGIKDESTARSTLEQATVALITATTIVNGTIEQILNQTAGARHVALLGPSTPLVPDAFRETPVTHLGGAVSSDNGRILRIVSEGGGTPIMRPYLRFVTLVRNRNE